MDFYREADALLFRERDDEIRDCSSLMLGYGLKFLLLHGSSGSGKSSFLRAGVIPDLKRHRRSPSYFINAGDGVIRCTGDPILEIAKTLIVAMDQSAAVTDGSSRNGRTSNGNEDELIDAATRRSVRDRLTTALTRRRKRLAEAVLDALTALSGELPGTLVLLFDQAEEVLTLASGGPEVVKDAASAFFWLLEEIYVRNVDIRLLMTLRTEYYGRFRDELQISDDRLSRRPASGGVQPFLLRSIRDKATLSRIVASPTTARDHDGKSAYGFTFESNELIDEIVGDVLTEFETSVTPAIQVVCAALHSELTREKRQITIADYRRLDGARGIVRSYVDKGIRGVSSPRQGDIDRWYLLLHSLVSRQGGGTVVSLTERAAVLGDRARGVGITSDVERALNALTSGSYPLLRGEPADQPVAFSLKHDVLAVQLARWHDRYGAAIGARNEERRKWRFRLGASVVFAGALLVSGGWVLTDRSKSLAMLKHETIEMQNHYAAHASVSNFNTSLLLLLNNLNRTQRDESVYEKLADFASGNHAATLNELRELMPRVPRVVGRFPAVGFDGAERKVAYLADASVTEVDLPLGNVLPLGRAASVGPLPLGAQAQQSQPVVGFVSGLGAVAYVGGMFYFFDGDAPQTRPVAREVLKRLADFAKPFTWPMLSGGNLILSKPFNQVAGDDEAVRTGMYVLRLTAEDLRASPVRLPAEVPPMVLARHPLWPAILFSDSHSLPWRYAALDAGGAIDARKGERLAHGPASPPAGAKEIELDLLFGEVANASTIAPARIAVARVPLPQGIPERQAATFAFAANADSVVFKFDEASDFYVVDLSRTENRPGNDVERVQHVSVDNESSLSTRLRQTGVGWFPPPLAGVRIGSHWRVAWLGRSGVTVVESSDEQPGIAHQMQGSPLLTAPPPDGPPPPGGKLQFTESGDFLILLEGQGFGGNRTSLRVWDLRPVWRDWCVLGADEAQLRAVACEIVRSDRGVPDFDKDDRSVFQIGSVEGPCVTNAQARY